MRLPCRALALTAGGDCRHAPIQAQRRTCALLYFRATPWVRAGASAALLAPCCVCVCVLIRARAHARFAADVQDVAWSPREDLLASCSVDNDIRIWAVSRATLEKSVVSHSLHVLSAHRSWVKGLAWDPLGNVRRRRAAPRTHHCRADLRRTPRRSVPDQRQRRQVVHRVAYCRLGGAQRLCACSRAAWC